MLGFKLVSGAASFQQLATRAPARTMLRPERGFVSERIVRFVERKSSPPFHMVNRCQPVSTGQHRLVFTLMHSHSRNANWNSRATDFMKFITESYSGAGSVIDSCSRLDTDTRRSQYVTCIDDSLCLKLLVWDRGELGRVLSFSLQ